MSTSINDIQTKKESSKENNKIESVNWKSYGVLAILFLIVTSDIFQENILSCFGSALNGREITLMGAIISAIILIIAHILIIHQLND
jgi:hypothetical protein